MGTRGAIGIHIDGQTKATYNQFDSYPDALGESMVAAVRHTMADPERGIYWLKDKGRALQALRDEDVTPKILKALKGFENTGVGSPEDVLYRATREMQGNILAYLETGYMPEATKFLADSLFCEYAYIINLDDCTLEMYRGFQAEAHNQGRYSTMPPHESTGYFPVALVASFPLNAIPEDWKAQAFPGQD